MPHVPDKNNSMGVTVDVLVVRRGRKAAVTLSPAMRTPRIRHQTRAKSFTCSAHSSRPLKSRSCHWTNLEKQQVTYCSAIRAMRLRMQPGTRLEEMMEARIEQAKLDVRETRQFPNGSRPAAINLLTGNHTWYEGRSSGLRMSLSSTACGVANGSRAWMVASRRGPTRTMQRLMLRRRRRHSN
ncbi:hypothetical protein K458DRAFT_164156 [Lentithecium fluviatile CBS 122367]|uniref:Uncharacterized protein n=1 Tax=Lentithecium fluviatile CBS 122367 TaxID=1168545 RepID=A0A6G1IG84_9PLEO|nr:hypothetical protein K458DRAFT_164156 [Lentithecium fluviatile CBS 122367]